MAYVGLVAKQSSSWLCIDVSFCCRVLIQRSSSWLSPELTQRDVIAAYMPCYRAFADAQHSDPCADWLATRLQEDKNMCQELEKQWRRELSDSEEKAKRAGGPYTGMFVTRAPIRDCRGLSFLCVAGVRCKIRLRVRVRRLLLRNYIYMGCSGDYM